MRRSLLCTTQVLRGDTGPVASAACPLRSRGLGLNARARRAPDVTTARRGGSYCSRCPGTGRRAQARAASRWQDQESNPSATDSRTFRSVPGPPPPPQPSRGVSAVGPAPQLQGRQEGAGNDGKGPTASSGPAASQIRAGAAGHPPPGPAERLQGALCARSLREWLATRRPWTLEAAPVARAFGIEGELMNGANIYAQSPTGGNTAGFLQSE